MKFAAPRLLFLLLLPLLALHFPAWGAESEPYRSDIAEARLEANGPIRAGEKFKVNLAVKLAPGWHTYTDPPGDAGMAPVLAWTLPPGFSAGKIIYPSAQTFSEGGFKTYGYTDRFTLSVPITPASALSAAEYKLKLRANFLTCNNICIPETANLELTLPAAAGGSAGSGFLLALLLALLGGLILNLMPCVLPVLALKALHIVKHGHARNEALSYAAGVLCAFAVLAGALLGLKSAGAAIGWGYQLQSPGFVAFLAALMVLIGLNLAGVFRISIPAISLPAGSFFTGALAAVVATPCTAPFMAAAVGYALTVPALPALAVFEAMGLGLALPFLAIGFFPPLQKLLPKPGPWMERFRQLLAIPMFATALWLLWVLAMQATPGAKMIREGEAYSAERLDAFTKAGEPVFVDATAAWCITCQVNEHTSLLAPEVRRAFAARHIHLLVADWTRQDANVTALLSRFGRRGVPLYVYFPPHAPPRILPQLLTPRAVLETITSP